MLSFFARCGVRGIAAFDGGRVTAGRQGQKGVQDTQTNVSVSYTPSCDSP